MSLDNLVHQEIMRAFAERGHAPDTSTIAARLAVSTEEVETSLHRLHEQHALVLHPDRPAIWVAHPFSTSPTGVWVAAAPRGWWAPCVWCACGISALTAPDATIHARLGGESRETCIVMHRGELASADLLVHFALPARDAWKNVIHYCSTVLPFDRPEAVDAWCKRHALPRGATVQLSQVLALAREWYGNYLDPHWSKWTLAQAQAIFDRVGLCGDAWRLPLNEGTF